jgi:hypothetical protein
MSLLVGVFASVFKCNFFSDVFYSFTVPYKIVHNCLIGFGIQFQHVLYGSKLLHCFSARKLSQKFFRPKSRILINAPPGGRRRKRRRMKTRVHELDGRALGEVLELGPIL